MARTITSLQNPRVKSAVRLRRHRAREGQQRVIIDGVRELALATRAGIQVLEVFVCPELLGDEGRQLADALTRGPAEVWNVTQPVFEKLAFGQRAEGLVAIAQRPKASLEDIAIGNDSLIVVLEAVEKPGNVGAVLRTADGAGAGALVVADPRTDLYNPNTIRASLGAVFTVPTAAATGAEALAWLRAHGAAIFAARVDGDILYTDVSFCGRCAIVLGNEAEGLSPVWQGPDVTAIRLPMHGVVDSLNVSAAAAVVLYEALRQRSAMERRAGRPV